MVQFGGIIDLTLYNDTRITVVNILVVLATNGSKISSEMVRCTCGSLKSSLLL